MVVETRLREDERVEKIVLWKLHLIGLRAERDGEVTTALEIIEKLKLPSAPFFAQRVGDVVEVAFKEPDEVMKKQIDDCYFWQSNVKTYLIRRDEEMMMINVAGIDVGLPLGAIAKYVEGESRIVNAYRQKDRVRGKLVENGVVTFWLKHFTVQMPKRGYAEMPKKTRIYWAKEKMLKLVGGAGSGGDVTALVAKAAPAATQKTDAVKSKPLMVTPAIKYAEVAGSAAVAGDGVDPLNAIAGGSAEIAAEKIVTAENAAEKSPEKIAEKRRKIEMMGLKTRKDCDEWMMKKAGRRVSEEEWEGFERNLAKKIKEVSDLESESEPPPLTLVEERYDDDVSDSNISTDTDGESAAGGDESSMSEMELYSNIAPSPEQRKEAEIERRRNRREDLR